MTMTKKDRRKRDEQNRRRDESLRQQAEDVQRLVSEAPNRIASAVGTLPDAQVLLGALLQLAEKAYEEQVVQSDMADLIGESRGDWIDGWLIATLEPFDLGAASSFLPPSAAIPSDGPS